MQFGPFARIFHAPELLFWARLGNLWVTGELSAGAE
jgi:hypothetical protein